MKRSRKFEDSRTVEEKFLDGIAARFASIIGEVLRDLMVCYKNSERYVGVKARDKP